MQHVQNAYCVCVKDNSPAADIVVAAVGCCPDALHLFCALNAFCVSQLKWFAPLFKEEFLRRRDGVCLSFFVVGPNMR